MLRLVAYAHEGVQRFAIDRSELLIGSAEGCDILLPFPGVGPEHARLHAHRDRLRIEDLGTRRGVLVNGRRVRQAELRSLDEIRLGSVALLVEDAASGAPESREETPEETIDRRPSVSPGRLLEHLARVSQWVLTDASSSTTLESLTVDLLEDFGGGVLFLFQGEGDDWAIKFVVTTGERWLGCAEELLEQIDPGLGSSREGSQRTVMGRIDGERGWIGGQALVALDRRYLLVAALPGFEPRRWSPMPALEVLGHLLILGLVHHVGQFEPILLAPRATSDLTLAPGLVVGESRATKRLLEQLRVVVEPGVHVLLQGEPGVSKELLARSLHLSGPNRDGPFVVASCGGARPVQVEADLFGAEIKGKRGPVIREGKLVQADGGTLFLRDVDRLSLELQDRLVRFLRSGEVEPAGSSEKRGVELRLVAGCRSPLEQYVARDLFRIDLAYLLSQFAIEVPALRDRREDLPLLIQAAVNRACHETGKRVQGITVRTLEALTIYDYPGNLPELDNIIRRLVYLCPSGQPIDDSLLPREVLHTKLRLSRPESSSELHLETLVADCERAAIREALKRSRGNKSEAARQLGLSRNGLSMKMNRLGLARSGTGLEEER